jgi:ABC-2 type transport system ATP-binding protein
LSGFSSVFSIVGPIGPTDGSGCQTELHEDLLRVRLPEGRNQTLLWELAHATQVQVRYLRPQRSTLEEVFLQAVEQKV